MDSLTPKRLDAVRRATRDAENGAVVIVLLVVAGVLFLGASIVRNAADPQDVALALVAFALAVWRSGR